MQYFSFEERDNLIEIELLEICNVNEIDVSFVDFSSVAFFLSFLKKWNMNRFA